ncbi:hypothetical protein P3S67_005232 [Capsicum chacoense]
MCLKKGCSLLLKVEKKSLPLILNVNPTSNVDQLNGQNGKNPVDPKESDVLKRLKYEENISTALEYFKGVANSSSFKHAPLAYKIMMEKLEKKQEMNSVQYLLQQMKLEGISCFEDTFISVIDAYRRGKAAEQALKTFYRIQDFGCKPTVRIYNHLLDALLSENRFHMINLIYSNMKKDGIVPNVYTYNILLKALCKNNRVDGAQKLLVEMSNKGCSPDEVSYTTIVSSLCKFGKVKKPEN